MMGSNTLVPPRIGVGEQIAHTLKIFVDVLVFTLPWLLQRLAISPTYLAEAGGFYVAMGSSVAVLAALDASTCQANTTDRMRRTFASSLTVHPTSIIPHDSTSRQPHGSAKVLYHSPAGMFQGFRLPQRQTLYIQEVWPTSGTSLGSPMVEPVSFTTVRLKCLMGFGCRNGKPLVHAWEWHTANNSAGSRKDWQSVGSHTGWQCVGSHNRLTICRQPTGW